MSFKDELPAILHIPLFPLNTVLFPHLPLSLHIFEDRYKTMINLCLERESPFGIALIQEGAEVGAPAVPSSVGCIARIVAADRLDDGRMQIMVVGWQRFRLLDYQVMDPPYLMGRIELIEESPVPPQNLASLCSKLSALFMRYLEVLAELSDEAMPALSLPSDPETLSYCVASALALLPEQKQSMLELTDTALRMETEILWIKAQLEELKNPRPGQPLLQPSEIMTVPMELEGEELKKYLDEGRN